MYWNGGQVIGAETGAGFYDPDGSLGQDYVWKTEAERARYVEVFGKFKGEDCDCTEVVDCWRCADRPRDW